MQTFYTIAEVAKELGLDAVGQQKISSAANRGVFPTIQPNGKKAHRLIAQETMAQVPAFMVKEDRPQTSSRLKRAGQLDRIEGLLTQLLDHVTKPTAKSLPFGGKANL